MKHGEKTVKGSQQEKNYTEVTIFVRAVVGTQISRPDTERAQTERTDRWEEKKCVNTICQRRD